MSELEGLEMDPVQEPHRRSGGWGPIVAVVAALLAVGLIYLFVRSETADEPPAGVGASPVEPVAASPPPAEAPSEEEDLELPALDASDDVVRRLTEKISDHPVLASWLVHDGLVRRFVVSVANVAEGLSPRKNVPFMKPEGTFSVVEAGGRVRPSPEAFRRYDLATGVFTSLDSQATATLYRQLEPLFEEAYRDLGYPRGGFDRTLTRAIRHLLETPVGEASWDLEPHLKSYRHADPEVEALSAAQKQLLRLGPENARRVQAKLRALGEALGLDVT